MIKLLSELEQSTEVLERQEYAERMLIYIKKLESDLKEYDKLGLSEKFIKAHKEGLKNWKIKLSNFDVYLQDSATTCEVCKETPCICYELTRSKGQMSGELPESNGVEPTGTGKDVESIQRETGNYSDNPSREELIKELPF